MVVAVVISSPAFLAVHLTCRRLDIMLFEALEVEVSREDSEEGGGQHCLLRSLQLGGKLRFKAIQLEKRLLHYQHQDRIEYVSQKVFILGTVQNICTSP
jgi:hypothetical protein